MTRRRLVAALAAVVIVIGAVALDIAAYDTRLPPDVTADAAIVLGAAVWDDDPSPVFAARLDHALDLYRQRRVRRLLLTGGTRDSTVAAESDAGRWYLEARGVPADAITTEARSRTTWQNLACIQPAVGPREVVLVSDPLHLRRAVAMARDLGLDARPSATPTSRYRSVSTRAQFLARETYFRVADAVAQIAGVRGGCPPREASSGIGSETERIGP